VFDSAGAHVPTVAEASFAMLDRYAGHIHGIGGEV
jgi:hypothetical protein